MRHNLTVLGATGTIGVNTLDVVSRHPDKFRVIALTGQNQIDKLAQQCRQFRPRYAVVLDDDKAGALRALLAGGETEVLAGLEALEFVSALPEVDSVMAAIVGAAGLRPALAAARAGKRVLLANKETLVMAGRFFMEAVKEHVTFAVTMEGGDEAALRSVSVHEVDAAVVCIGQNVEANLLITVLRSIRADFLQDIESWIFMPLAVRFSISAGTRFAANASMTARAATNVSAWAISRYSAAATPSP